MSENATPEEETECSGHQRDPGDSASPWPDWKKRFFEEPISLFTLLLVIIGALQFCTLKITNDNYVATERAFVFANTAELIPDRTTNPDAWWFAPHWENGGNTTTQKLSMQGNWANISTWEDKMTRCDFAVQKPKTEIGPKSFIEVPFFSIPTAILTSKNLHIWGHAQYDDGFNTGRITRFCWTPTVLLGDPTNGNYRITLIHSLCLKGNCIDDECKQEDNELFPDGPATCQMSIAH